MDGDVAFMSFCVWFWIVAISHNYVLVDYVQVSCVCEIINKYYILYVFIKI